VAGPEMLRTFNCGIGMIAIVEADAIGKVTEVLAANGESVARLGEVVPARGESRVVYRGELDLAW
jgi:phosphoribosylformylglycinamidine cyclo-ligase